MFLILVPFWILSLNNNMQLSVSISLQKDLLECDLCDMRNVGAIKKEIILR